MEFSRGVSRSSGMPDLPQRHAPGPGYGRDRERFAEIWTGDSAFEEPAPCFVAERSP